jgi:hypothetical protein
MSDAKGKSETHGCIVCGKLYQLIVAYSADGNYIGSKVMSTGGKEVPYPARPLVACERHTEDEIERAVKRVFETNEMDDE